MPTNFNIFVLVLSWLVTEIEGDKNIFIRIGFGPGLWPSCPHTPNATPVLFLYVICIVKNLLLSNIYLKEKKDRQNFVISRSYSTWVVVLTVLVFFSWNEYKCLTRQKKIRFDDAKKDHYCREPAFIEYLLYKERRHGQQTLLSTVISPLDTHRTRTFEFGFGFECSSCPVS